MNLRPILFGTALVCGLVDRLEAQTQQSLVSVGVVAGVSSTAGQYANHFYGTGGQLGVLSQVRTPLSWLSVRIDAGYQSLGGRTAWVTDADGKAVGPMQRSDAMYSAAASLVLRWPGLRTTVQPYALAGGGSYWVRSSASLPSILLDPIDHSVSATTRTNGFNVGAGLEAPYRRAIVFGEVRYQQFGQLPMRFVPVSVGVRLR